jgi:DNA-binding CsgD family transcriptional regulator
VKTKYPPLPSVLSEPMETLSIDDLQKLNQGIQQLYTLHDFEDFAVQSIQIMNQLVPSDIPSFLVVNFQTQQIQDTFLPDFPGLTAAMEQARIIFFNEHPVIQRVPKTLDGAYKISDFLTPKELESSEGIYQRYLRTLGMVDHMCMSIGASNTLPSSTINIPAVALYRNKYSFTERDRTILNLLRPHLFQAYSNAKCCKQLQHNLSQLQRSLHHLGLIILDTEGRVQSIAPQATQWLAIYFPKPTTSQAIPDYLWSWIKHQINCLTNNSELSNAVVPLRIQQADQELTIRLIIEPDRPRYLLLLEEQTLSPLSSLALLGLSQRETEVLFWVMQGKDNKSIALQLAVGVSTVRKHLENIYHKLGVQSRTEAIAQALTKLGVL